MTTDNQATMAKQIREYLKQHPGSTARQIADTLGFPISRVSSRLSQDKMAGHVRYEVSDSTLSKRPIHSYYLTNNTASLPNPYEIKRTRKRREMARSEDDGTLEGLIDALAAALVAQVIDRAKPLLRNALPSLLPTPPAEDDGTKGVIHPPEPKMLPTPRKPRVAVVGLLPQQAGYISNEYSDVFALNFPDRDAPFQLRKAAEGSDVVFEMTKFIPHAAEEILKKGSAELVRVPGGLSDLRRALTLYHTRKDA